MPIKERHSPDAPGRKSSPSKPSLSPTSGEQQCPGRRNRLHYSEKPGLEGGTPEEWMETFSNDLRLRIFPQLLSGALGVLEESARRGKRDNRGKGSSQAGGRRDRRGPRCCCLTDLTNTQAPNRRDLRFTVHVGATDQKKAARSARPRLPIGTVHSRWLRCRVASINPEVGALDFSKSRAANVMNHEKPAQ